MSEQLNKAGDFIVEELSLVSAEGKSVFLDGFLVELNIYEDMFSNFVHGNIVLSDSLNLMKKLPIKGSEILTVKIKSPTAGQTIDKRFQVFSVTDRIIARDTNTQVFRLNFMSQEGFADGATVLWKKYDGSIGSIIQTVYDEDLKVGTELQVFSGTKNKAKITANGWSPYKIINWLSNKAEPSSGKACNFLFWETCQKAYYGTVEDIIKKGDSVSAGEYTYKPMGPTRDGTVQSMNEAMLSIESFNVIKTGDFLQNHVNGYLGSRAIGLDLIKKQWKNTDYDHVEKFNEYTHLADKGLFRNEALRNNTVVRRVFPIHRELFKGFKDNINEKEPELFGNRLSHLAELNNYKLNIIIPGRTNLEAGQIIKVRIPDTSPTDERDKSKKKEDGVYSGKYLITALHHKFNPVTHSCSLELLRDSVSTNKED